MTLKPSQIRELLNLKRQDFTLYNREILRDLQQYREAWVTLLNLSDEELAERLADQPDRLAAFPLEPLSKAPDGVIPFNLTWQSREQSLAWVRDRLTGISTFAVDGSQIYPSKDLSVPIALVQIGWFENPHLPAGDYEKDIALDIMTPSDLKVGENGDFGDRQVNFRRFQMEIDRLVQYMEEHANREDCLVFFDGSLVGTFADAFDRDLKLGYVHCLLTLLRTSQTCRVPLVGYVDTSRARDLVTMLQTLFKLPESPIVSDAGLVNKVMEWGDRTPLFRCDRTGILENYEEQRDQIAFTYLKTTREGYPARLEIPVWMQEAGLVDRVVDWVRGEVVVGSGYPYVIETADQTAVLQTEDRQAFYRILQDWAEDVDLNLRLSRKMVSKVRRR
ncbi:MAG: DNA double-strand break repair nuclease NurA [Leptolyngbyaceae cyanobacterium SL_7_1]|nr:DNA double-strand break repair nuclease NurA [Leptolyngbyaceae cyanobacterium SL_7_1]